MPFKNDKQRAFFNLATAKMLKKKGIVSAIILKVEKLKLKKVKAKKGVPKAK